MCALGELGQAMCDEKKKGTRNVASVVRLLSQHKVSQARVCWAPTCVYYCVGFCGPRSSSETRTRTQRHVRHTLDTRRQKSQVSQSGQLLLICVLREGKRRSACCNCRNNSRRFFVFSNIGRRRERTILNGASLPELQFKSVAVCNNF